MDAIKFYRNEYYQCMELSDHGWEARHDFIQFLFPNDEPSASFSTAPVLTPEVQKLWLESPTLQDQHRKDFYRFLKHIGLHFDLLHGTITVANKGLVLRRIVWRDHNQWRITRVLRSMRLLGQPQLSNELYKVLLNINEEYGGINSVTLDYWHKAMVASTPYT